MEIKYHSSNLISIKYERLRETFFKLISLFNFERNGLKGYLALSRPNFKLIIPEGMEILYKDKDEYEFIIELNNSDRMSILRSVEWGWDEFEFFELLIISNERKLNSTNVFRNTPEFNSNYFDGVSIHKGIEADVIWIAKSKQIDLDLSKFNMV